MWKCLACLSFWLIREVTALKTVHLSWNFKSKRLVLPFIFFKRLLGWLHFLGGVITCVWQKSSRDTVCRTEAPGNWCLAETNYENFVKGYPRATPNVLSRRYGSGTKLSRMNWLWLAWGSRGPPPAGPLRDHPQIHRTRLSRLDKELTDNRAASELLFIAGRSLSPENMDGESPVIARAKHESRLIRLVKWMRNSHVWLGVWNIRLSWLGLEIAWRITGDWARITDDCWAIALILDCLCPVVYFEV